MGMFILAFVMMWTAAHAQKCRHWRRGCRKTFGRSIRLAHEKVCPNNPHSDRSEPCEVCGNTFKKREMEAHIMNEHPNSKKGKQLRRRNGRRLIQRLLRE